MGAADLLLKKGDLCRVVVDECSSNVILVTLEHVNRKFSGVLLDVTNGASPVNSFLNISLSSEAKPASSHTVNEDGFVELASPPADIDLRPVGPLGAGLRNTHNRKPGGDKEENALRTLEEGMRQSSGTSYLATASQRRTQQRSQQRFARNRQLRPRQTFCINCKKLCFGGNSSGQPSTVSPSNVELRKSTRTTNKYSGSSAAATKCALETTNNHKPFSSATDNIAVSAIGSQPRHPALANKKSRTVDLKISNKSPECQEQVTIPLNRLGLEYATHVGKEVGAEDYNCRTAGGPSSGALQSGGHPSTKPVSKKNPTTKATRRGYRKLKREASAEQVYPVSNDSGAALVDVISVPLSNIDRGNSNVSHSRCYETDGPGSESRPPSSSSFSHTINSPHTVPADTSPQTSGRSKKVKKKTHHRQFDSEEASVIMSPAQISTNSISHQFSPTSLVSDLRSESTDRNSTRRRYGNPDDDGNNQYYDREVNYDVDRGSCEEIGREDAGEMGREGTQESGAFGGHEENGEDEEEEGDDMGSVMDIRTRDVALYTPPGGGERLGLGDVVWGKLQKQPWWPGKIVSMTKSEHTSTGNVLAHVALVSWYGMASTSNVSCSALCPFLSHYERKFRRTQRRGPYLVAVRKAKIEARSVKSSSRPAATASSEMRLD